MSLPNMDYIRKRYVNDSYIPEFEYQPISICTPMYNSMPFIQTYLTTLLLHDYPQDLISLHFTVQGNDGTYDALREFRKDYGDTFRKIKFKRMKQLKGELPHVQNVVHCRNTLAEWSKPDTVFYNDHDNFNPPYSIKRLLESLALGASGAAGIYVFHQINANESKEEAGVGFTSFFMRDGKMHHFALKGGDRGYLPLEMFGKRMWMDAVSCGCFMVKRELLDEVKFFVPYGTSMTDDTAYCLKARSLGHKLIGDFGLIVDHWGFHINFRRMMYLQVDFNEKMFARRRKMRTDGVYVHPDVDVNISDKVKEYIDIDKIK